MFVPPHPAGKFPPSIWKGSPGAPELGFRVMNALGV
jgi:hypothetical protein